MSRPSARAFASALSCVLVLATAAAAEAVDDYDLVLECRTALWKASFDEATAAGLEPGAVVVSFSGTKARTVRGEGTLTVSAREEYRPSHRAPGVPVRYECVVDLATRAVRSVTWVALDASGAEVARPAVEVFRDAVLLSACGDALRSEVRAAALKEGLSKDGNDAEPDPATVVRAGKGKLVELTGRGRARLTSDYEWQPVTFGCRWDPRKEAVAKAWVSPVGAWKLGALSPERQEMLEACRHAVRDAVFDDAGRRGYRWPRDLVEVGLSRTAAFEASGATTTVSGEGWFRSDARHAESTPITFRCAWDAGRRAVASASFEAGAASRSPSGEIASGRTGTLVCESYGKEQKVCAAAVRGNVRVLRQLGRVPCKAYENWIYSPSGITVWGGCAAEFEFDTK